MQRVVDHLCWLFSLHFLFLFFFFELEKKKKKETEIVNKRGQNMAIDHKLYGSRTSPEDLNTLEPVMELKRTKGREKEKEKTFGSAEASLQYKWHA